MGKWHLGLLPKFGRLLSGYDHFYGFRSGGIDYYRHEGTDHKKDLWDDDMPIEKIGYATDLFGDHAVDVINGYAKVRNPFLRKLALSAAQSLLFNDYLARRMADGLLRTVLAGDVMAKWPAGGMFTAEDVPTEQARFDRRELVTAGPMFGRKTFPSKGVAAEREAAVLEAAGLSRSSFEGFGKLVMGTRRHNLVYVEDLATIREPDGLWLTFTLPAGSYATVLLREVMKSEVQDEDAPAED